MKKILLIGQVGSGKTTLKQRLRHEDVKYLKTQAIEYGEGIIDTPGEFLQRRWQYNALCVTAVEADVIGLVLNPVEPIPAIPANFTTMLNRPVIGIINKIDLAPDERYLELARGYLKEAGAEQIFVISAKTEQGLDALAEYLEISPGGSCHV